VNKVKNIKTPTKKIRRDTSSALLLHTAAQALGYSVREVKVNGKINLSRFGFFVEHDNKRCYISAQSYFPNVPRWQLALMDNKLITTAILEQSPFSTIKTILFTNKDSLPLRKLVSDILNQPLPILIKPTSGQD